MFRALNHKSRVEFSKVLSDPEVQKKFQGSRQSSLQKGARVFATELVPQIDGPARERSTVRMLSFYSVPRHLSTDDYETKFQTLLEKYVALPVVQKNLTCGELVRRSLTSAYRATIWHCFKWLQNYTLDDYLLALGHSAPKPTFVLYAESEV
jgi:hypothetical protein